MRKSESQSRGTSAEFEKILMRISKLFEEDEEFGESVINAVRKVYGRDDVTHAMGDAEEAVIGEKILGLLISYSQKQAKHADSKNISDEKLVQGFLATIGNPDFMYNNPVSRMRH